LFRKALCAAALLAAPAALTAQPLAETHERVSQPGKTVILMRPIAKTNAKPAFCHPETSKAMGCIAQARARTEAQAQAYAAQTFDQLTER